jgi:predicted small secreted protein
MIRLTMKLLALFTLLSPALLSACAEVKDAGKTIGHTTRNVTREIGHGTRDVTRTIGHGTRDTVKRNHKVSD